MKLKINGFENQIIFNSTNINILEISDAKCYSHIINILNDRINGKETNEIFLLNDLEDELKIENEMVLIFDVFNIDYNTKKILNKIYYLISEHIQKKQDFEIERMALELRNQLIEEINELPFEFEMKSELDISEILKLFQLKIDGSNYNSVLEKVEILIDLISTLKIAKILVIPNLKMFLNTDELLELYKYSLYNNINLLIIERNNEQKLKYEKIMKIDSSFDDFIE